MNYGWKGNINDFLSLNLPSFINDLEIHVFGDLPSSEKANQLQKINSQKKAWEDCFYKLKDILQHYRAIDGWLIFEYNILRGGGRRPDILLLLPGHVLVIECKSYNQISQSEYIQTSLYVRDIEHYHSTIHKNNLKVTGCVLVTSNSSEQLIAIENHQIYVTTPNSFSQLLDRLIKKSTNQSVNMTEFLNGHYEPSPSMLEAARSILKNEPLPQIKAIASSNFEQVQNTVEKIMKEAEASHTHHLVLVSGEPGAGKTFLGLNIAHDTDHAVYLSGNGPLVNVLQDTLQNKTFVQALYGYKMDYLRYFKVPSEQVIIFDEAQRAWDASKVDQSLQRNGRQLMNLSEPDIIIKIATQNKPWSVTIGLIGEGQEIYSGEESGLALWNQAIANHHITVHAKHNNQLFTNAADYRQHDHLHLNCSLRAHAALYYYEIVNSLLNNNFSHSAKLIGQLPKTRYSLFVTQDINLARSVVHELYADDVKTFGIICTSGADKQKEITVIPRDVRYQKVSSVAQYFNYPDSPYFCKNLCYSTTEFHTQGLELDTVIVHWDDDLYIQDGQWRAQHFQRDVEDPFQIKLNSYRVILTRGRDGTIIYIPPKPILDETWVMFTKNLGIPILS